MSNNNASNQSSGVYTPQSNIVAEVIPDHRTELKLLIEGGAMNLTVDLKAVSMVDSCGVGLLVAAHNSLTKNGGALTVVNASGDLMFLFKTLSLDRHFKISGAGN